MYTCPMHPEIVSEEPGKCPKCGMALVLKQNVLVKAHKMEDKGLGEITWKSYFPLLVIVAMILLVSYVALWGKQFSLTALIINFMTGFFLIFAGFKIIDLKGFAEGYSTYDLLAQKWFGYGYVYPFIELGFGLLMLAGFHTPALLWTEFAIMAFSGVGVAIKIAKGEEFQCACLGTFLKIPLTKVTLIEDFGMAILALILIFQL